MNEDIAAENLTQNLIKDFPELPEAIKVAYENDDLVVFVGAGISRLMGCEGWNDMSNKLINATCNAATANQITSSTLPSKAKITIAKRYAERNGSIDKFWEIFKQAITADSKKEDIYNTIETLNTIFITTNCDGLLVKKFKRDFETNCTQKTFVQHTRPFVFCIHGNWGDGTEQDKGTLVFTAEDYLEKYRPSSELYEFLKAVFQKTVLFIGYGLSEFEILNVVFDKKDNDATCRHFSLEGFFKYEQEYCDAVSAYYSSVGVKIIPYSKDENGYDQQIEIIKRWVEELLNTTRYIADEVNRIGEALKSFTEHSKDEIRRCLSRTDGVEKTGMASILRRLPDCRDCFDWLSFIIQEYFISTDNIPSRISADDGICNPACEIFTCIETCLRQRKPSDHNKKILSNYIQAAVRYIIEDKENISDVAICQLGEVIFAMGDEPDNYEMSIITEMIKRSGDAGFSVISENIERVCEWKPEYFNQIFKTFFEYNEDQRNKSYWFKRMSECIIKYCDINKLIVITRKCLCQLVAKEESADFHKSIEARYQAADYGYSYDLFNVVKLLFHQLDENTQKKLLSMVAENNEGCSFPVQLTLYLARDKKLNIINLLPDGVFDKYNVFIDFYLWMDDVVSDQECLKADDVMRISGWIDATDFGTRKLSYRDDAEREYYKKAINTRKYQLLELLMRVGISATDNTMRDHWIALSQADRLNLKTPKEENPAWTFRLVDKAEIEKKTDEWTGLSGKKIIEKVRVGSYQKSFSSLGYTYRIIGRAIEYWQTVELLDESLKLEINEMASVACILLNDNVINTCEPEELESYIVAYAGRLADDSQVEDREAMADIVVHVLKALEGKMQDSGNFLDLMTRIYDDRIFVDSLSDTDLDITMELINTPKAQFFMLAIDLAQRNFDDNELAEKLVNWFEKLFKAGSVRCLCQSCAFEIETLFDINREWTVNRLIPEFEKKVWMPELSVFMCMGTNVAYKKVTRFMIESAGLKEIFEYIQKIPRNDVAAMTFINHMVAAEYFGHITADEYLDFVKSVPNEFVDKMIRAVVAGVQDGDLNKEKVLFTRTYEQYLKRGDADNRVLYRSAIKHWCENNRIDADCWKFVLNALSELVALDDTNKALGIQQLWSDVERGIFNSKEPNETIDQVLSILEKNENPESYIIDDIIEDLTKLGMPATIRNLARFAVNRRIGNVNEYSTYIDKPVNVS